LPNIFRNLNTPEEYEAVVAEMEVIPTGSVRGPHS